MNGMMKLRVSLASLGFGVALMFAPAAHAQAESSPDHFTETGVEVGPGGTVHQQAAQAHTSTAKTTAAKPAVAQAKHEHASVQPVQVAMAVPNKHRPVIAAAQKQQ